MRGCEGGRHDLVTRPRRHDDRQGRRAGAPVGRQRGDHPPLAVARDRPALDPPRARLLLRPPRPQGALQAGLPRRRVGRHPAAGRRARRSRSCSTGWPTSRSTGRRTSRSRSLGSGVWAYFSSTLQAGTNSLLYNAELLTKVAVPAHRGADGDVPARVHRPRRGGRAGVRRRPRVRGTACHAARARRSGCRSALVLLVLAVAGPVYLLSAAVVKYRDVSTLVGFGVQLLLFASPVAFPPDLVPAELAHAAVPQPAQRRRRPAPLGARRHRPSRPPPSWRRRWPRRSSCCSSASSTSAAASASSRTSSDGSPVVSTVIELDAVGKRYRLGEHHGQGADLRDTLGPAGPPAPRRAARARSASSGRCATCRSASTRAAALGIIGSQRRRQEHPAQGHQRHHDADRGPSPDARSGRLAARGRHRLPRRADRASRTRTSTGRSSG